jgi:hypothetical protein
VVNDVNWKTTDTGSDNQKRTKAENNKEGITGKVNLPIIKEIGGSDEIVPYSLQSESKPLRNTAKENLIIIQKNYEIGGSDVQII